MYIAHPTHGAGTRPHRTQLKTTARKTTLNAGQCVRQPREGRGRNRQASPPPPKKKGGGRGKRHENSPQPPNCPPTPPQAAEPSPRRHRRQDPHRGTGGPPTQNRQHQASNRGPRGKGTPKRKKKKGEPTAQPERKGMEGQGPQSPEKKKKKKKEKTTAQKTHPDNPAKKGWAQPRPGPNTHAHTARRNRKRRGTSGAPTKPHTSQKQAETEAQPRTPQTADTRGTTPQTVPKHTHPRPQPGLARLTKPTPNRQQDPNTNAAQQ